MIAIPKTIFAVRLAWITAALGAIGSQGLPAETVLPPMPTPTPQAVSEALGAQPTAPDDASAPQPTLPIVVPADQPTAPDDTSAAQPPSRPAATTAAGSVASPSKPRVSPLAPEPGDQTAEGSKGAAGDEVGFASWYGSRFHGRLTANGEVYDMNKLTAANKTLPFGTIVKVTNLENGKSVDVTINDRGPFVAGRIIDLSRAAAEAVGLTSMGVAKVRLHIIKLGDGARVASAAAAAPRSSQPVILQLGAFHDLGNAVRLKDFLDQNGFNPLYEKAGDVTRVVLVSVPQGELSDVRERLAKIGINSVLVRHE